MSRQMNKLIFVLCLASALSARAETPELTIARGRLKALDRLISIENEAARRSSLQTERALINLQLARAEGLGKSSSLTVTQLKYLQLVEADTAAAMKAPKLSEDTRAYILYIRGMAVYDLGKFREATALMRESLNIKPDADYAPSLRLFLAEHELNNGHFKAAATYYEKAMPGLQGVDLQNALYRSAIAALRLGDQVAAEKKLLAVIKDQTSPHSSAAMVELASAASASRGEAALLNVADEWFGQTEARHEFLSVALASLRMKRPSGDWPQLRAALVGREKDARKRIEIFLVAFESNLKSKKLEAAGVELQGIQSQMQKLAPEQNKSVVAELGERLDEAVSHYISASMKELRAEAKTEKGAVVLAGRLDSAGAFHEEFFPTSRDAIVVKKARLEILRATKDLARTLDLASRYLDNSNLTAVHREAANTVLFSCKDEAADKSLCRPIVERMAANEEGPRWKEANEWLASQALRGSDTKAALKRLESVYNRVPTEETFYRVQAARFAIGEYDELIAAKPNGFEMSDRLGKIVQEALLKTALGGASNDQTVRKANLKKFIAMSKDRSRSRAAQREFIDNLLNAHDDDQAADFLTEMNPKDRVHPEMKSAFKTVSRNMLVKGRFAVAFKMYDGVGATGDKEMEFEHLLSSLGNGAKPNATSLQALPSERRGTIYRYLALTSPSVLIDMFRKSSKRTDDLKQNVALAIRLHREEGVSAPADLTAALGSFLSAELSGGTVSRIESQLAGIKWPVYKAGQDEKFATKLSALMGVIRGIRKQVPKEIKGKSKADQVRILTAAAAAEKKTGEIIISTPPPPGASSADATEFMEGITVIAREFEKQATAFEKTMKAIDLSRVQAKAPDPGSFGTWPWKDPKLASEIKDLIRDRRHLAALIILDLRRGEGMIDAAEYQRGVAEVLLSIRNTDPMRIYVYDRIKAANQPELLGYWKKGA